MSREEDEQKMKAFFDGLSGKQRRRLTMAQRRVTGKRESMAAMMARLARAAKLTPIFARRASPPNS